MIITDNFIKERDEFESLRSEAKFDVKDKEALKFIRKVEKILIEVFFKVRIVVF